MRHSATKNGYSYEYFQTNGESEQHHSITSCNESEFDQGCATSMGSKSSARISECLRHELLVVMGRR
ncbi:hypothetical protein OSTOST_19177 [Ostertagia ostertagi]